MNEISLGMGQQVAVAAVAEKRQALLQEVERTGLALQALADSYAAAAGQVPGRWQFEQRGGTIVLVRLAEEEPQGE